MRNATRWTIVGIVAIHGVIHLVGVIEGFGWVDFSALTEPISLTMAFAWLLAALAVLTAGALLARSIRWWWIIGVSAVALSQSVIATSWDDARGGTLANVVLLLAAMHGFLAEGPRSLRATYRHLAAHAALSSNGPQAPLVTQEDLTHLPAPVAGYLSACGSIGRPRVRGFQARVYGRIRAGADKPWMTFNGAQVNTYGSSPSRVFTMDATMSGLPVDVLHIYRDAAATMRVKAGSVVTMVDASGPEMDQSETVTVLNDLCVLAPAALVDAPIEWTAVDDHHARATFTNGDHSVSAVLGFDDDHQLIDFVSDDRFRSSSDGREFLRQRWSTPIGGYRAFGERRLGSGGIGRWCPDDEEAFDYLQIFVEDIAYDESVEVRDEPAKPESVSVSMAPIHATVHAWSQMKSSQTRFCAGCPNGN